MYIGFDNFDEQRYAEDTERAAKQVLEREALLEEAFNQHFVQYFPLYISSHGASAALNLIGMEKIRKYLKEESIPELFALAKKHKEICEEEKKLAESRKRCAPLQEQICTVYADALNELVNISQTKPLSADDLRMMILDMRDDCDEKVTGLTEEYEALEEAEAEREMEADYRQFLIEEQEATYRRQQLYDTL